MSRAGTDESRPNVKRSRPVREWEDSALYISFSLGNREYIYALHKSLYERNRKPVISSSKFTIRSQNAGHIAQKSGFPGLPASSVRFPSGFQPASPRAETGSLLPHGGLRGVARIEDGLLRKHEDLFADAFQHGPEISSGEPVVADGPAEDRVAGEADSVFSTVRGVPQKVERFQILFSR